MKGPGSRKERHASRINEWLLAILRFAFTLEPIDQRFVLTIADELDAFGFDRKYAGSTYFFRTSAEFCAAIENRNYPMRELILYRFLSNVDDRRLNEALTAAISFGDIPLRPQTKSKHKLRPPTGALRGSHPKVPGSAE